MAKRSLLSEQFSYLLYTSLTDCFL